MNTINTMALFMLETLTSIGVNTGRMKLIILKKQSFVEKNTDSSLSSLDDLDIPRRPWGEHDCEANAGQLLCKNKTNMGNLPLSRWKTIEIFKTVRF